MSTVQPFPQTIEYWLPVIEEAVGGFHVVELLETRLSWIYLTTQHVYKIKKPLDLGASHNWSEAHRRQACLDEVRLNERLAPGVYLGVLPIVEESNGAVRLNGRGLSIEYAIKMRRLHGERSLSHLIEHNALSNEQVKSLAQWLTDFYKRLAPESIDVDTYCGRVLRRLHQNSETLKNADGFTPPSDVGQIESRLSLFVHQSREDLNVRVVDGRIVDGHGDLRADHVFFDRQPLIIDCTEYSANIRTLDALDDLAALAVDCEYLGRTDVGEQLLQQYRKEAHDDGPPAIEAFYKALHAMARAAEVLESHRRTGKPITSDSGIAAWLEIAFRYCSWLE